MESAGVHIGCTSLPPDEVISTNRIWTAKPLLVAYVVTVGFTVGLLINRTPGRDQAVPTLAADQQPERHDHNEVAEPPLWMQLFRPSQPTARLMLRLGLPMLNAVDTSVQPHEARHFVVYWTGAGERPQTFFQTMLPFLRPDGTEVVDVPPPVTHNPGTGTPPDGQAEPGTPTPVQPDPPQPDPPATVNNGQPVIGIYHTHDWESYISEFPAFKPKNEDDLKRIESHSHKLKTIIGIGEVLAKELQDRGVPTVHAKIWHQELGYDYAYKASRVTAGRILKDYPSVKVLLDMHRDGAWGADTTADINGKRAAQIRCIIGENQPNWKSNRAFCDQLMARLEAKYPGLTLETREQPYTYNQDLMAGAVLLEVGSALNHYAEAERSARYLAEVLAEAVRAGEYPK